MAVVTPTVVTVYRYGGLGGTLPLPARLIYCVGTLTPVYLTFGICVDLLDYGDPLTPAYTVAIRDCTLFLRYVILRPCLLFHYLAIYTHLLFPLP